MDLQFLKFMGAVDVVLEGEHHVTFGGSQSIPYKKNMYDDFLKEPSLSVKAWIRKRLQKDLINATAAPQWIEKLLPVWPLHNDKPMMFIGSVTVPQTATTEIYASPGATLFVFGARQASDEGGFSMVYQIVEQIPGL